MIAFDAWKILLRCKYLLQKYNRSFAFLAGGRAAKTVFSVTSFVPLCNPITYILYIGGVKNISLISHFRSKSGPEVIKFFSCSTQLSILF